MLFTAKKKKGRRFGGTRFPVCTALAKKLGMYQESLFVQPDLWIRSTGCTSNWLFAAAGIHSLAGGGSSGSGGCGGGGGAYANGVGGVIDGGGDC